MKKLLFVCLFLVIGIVSYSQVVNPVKWSFSSKKLDANTYEVHLTAMIDKGWHTYSQTTPEGGPVPTAISFTKNPLVSIEGKVKELGKMEQHHEPLFGVDVKQFSDKVDFVQVVKVKGSANTTVAGTIESMACNDKQCLPPSTEKFSVALK
ncbi:MAG: sugar transporter [Williamsia sp.]|nr:sugar transporter [Williamsia sp.]